MTKHPELEFAKYLGQQVEYDGDRGEVVGCWTADGLFGVTVQWSDGQKTAVLSPHWGSIGLACGDE